jgi:hypothetical protein
VIMTSDHSVSLVTYAPAPQRALMDAIIEIGDVLDEYDLTPSQITITVMPHGTDDDNYVSYQATAHLIELTHN